MQGLVRSQLSGFTDAVAVVEFLAIIKCWSLEPTEFLTVNNWLVTLLIIIGCYSC